MPRPSDGERTVVTWQDEEVTDGAKEETTGDHAHRRANLEKLGVHSRPAALCDQAVSGGW
jgi:hypothetical protein